MDNKKPNRPKTIKPEKKRLDADSLRDQLLSIPERTLKALTNLRAVKKEFGLPATMSGVTAKERQTLNMAFDSAGGFNAIYESMTLHAAELGQYPITSFVGYGVLQQIAQNGMIRACIQTVADDVSRRWITLDGPAEKVEVLEKLLKDPNYGGLSVKELFHRAVTTTGYMGGAFIFIDTGDADTELPLAINEFSAELSQSSNVRFVLVDPVNVSPISYNCTNPLDVDYMVPKVWQVLGRRVHASRMLTFIENQPPMLLRPNYNFLGIPQAQILWDYVVHFNKTRISAAKLLDKISLLVVQTDMDEILSSQTGVQDFDAKMEFLQRYRDNDSVFVCDKDSEAVTNVQTSIAGCTDIVRQSLELIACINRTPAVKLLGISPSGFNATGESDIKNYYDYIASKQELYRDQIQTIINVLQLTQWGYIDPSITFAFNSLSQDDKASKAMTAQTRIGALSQLVDRQAISAEELRDLVRQDPDLELSSLDEEMPEVLSEAEPVEPAGNMFESLINAEESQGTESS
jgi:phage-related protein (TIGR01555 family)